MGHDAVCFIWLEQHNLFVSLQPDALATNGTESEREDSILHEMYLFPNTTTKGELKFFEPVTADTAASRLEKVCKLASFDDRQITMHGLVSSIA
jgi:hypothetical protein